MTEDLFGNLNGENKYVVCTEVTQQQRTLERKEKEKEKGRKGP